MSSEVVRGGNSIYYSIKDGTFRQNVKPEHPDAVRRDWVSADGKETGTKYERIVHGLTGIIERVSVEDGKYGKQIKITLDANDDGKHPVMDIQASSKYGEDFLAKVPNVDFDKEVNVRPFSFPSKNDPDRVVQGLEILQKDGEGKFTVKIESKFVRREWIEAEKRSKIEYLDENYPKPGPDSKDWDNDEWKAYFAKARRYALSYLQEQVIPKLGGVSPVNSQEEEGGITYPEDEVNPDDIPF